MLALPKAYASVGILLGSGTTLAVAILTFYSCSIIVRHCALNGKDSYGRLIENEFGVIGSSVLQSSVIIHVSGVMVMYLIIINDMLVGSAPYWRGILSYIFDFDVQPWWLSRWCVSLCLLIVVVTPMLISRDLSIVARFTRFSVGLLLLLATALTSIAALAMFQDKAANVRFLPDMSNVGKIGGPEGLMSAILTVTAVSALAFTAQFNLIPVHNSMRDNRVTTMLHATRYALGLCAALYGCVALAGYTLFGDNTEGDVMKNLTVDFVATLVHRRLSEGIICFIVVANTINLLCNFVLKVWAVRESVCELVFCHASRDLSPLAFYLLTAVLVLGAYAVSVLVPSVWFLVSLVGGTACVTFSYVFPGLLVYRRGSTAFERFRGGSLVILAGVMATVTVFNTILGNNGV